MSRILIFAFLIALPFSVAAGQKKGVDSKVTDELIRLDKEWTAAEKRKDFAALNRIVGEEFMDTSALGHVRDRAQYMAEVGPYGSGISEPDEYVVRVYGKVAVMTHRTTLRDPDYQFRATHVWVKRDGRWQVVSTHYSTIRPDKK
jgi:hypothetical protein